MKSVKWLLEANVFDDEIDAIISAIDKQGLEYKIYTDTPSDPHGFLKLFDADDCVIFYGSLGLAQEVRRKAPWTPGVYCNLDRFNCAYYFPRLAQFLLNTPYMMLPFGELARRRDEILEYCGVDGKIFVRPNTGFKIFTGKVIDKDTWTKDLKFLAFHDVQPEAMVLVSAPRNIRAEWRLVVVGDKVVSGTQYILEGEIKHGPCPQVILDYGQAVLDQTDYRPEPAWCMDICSASTETDPGIFAYQVLEVGAFSTCGLYQCPMYPIVEGVSRVAAQEWEDVYELD